MYSGHVLSSLYFDTRFFTVRQTDELSCVFTLWGFQGRGVEYVFK